MRVVVAAHRPGRGEHDTRQHGRSHVRDTAVHAVGGVAGVHRGGGRPASVRPEGGHRDDDHAVRVQGQPAAAQ